jgi:hypothetical protein
MDDDVQLVREVIRASTPGSVAGRAVVFGPWQTLWKRHFRWWQLTEADPDP